MHRKPAWRARIRPPRRRFLHGPTYGIGEIGYRRNAASSGCVRPDGQGHAGSVRRQKHEHET